MKYTISLFLSLISLAVFGQKAEVIKGTVIEESSGKPIPGAIIKIKSAKKYANSDTEGNFSITVTEIGKYELEVSSVGYETKIVSEVEVIAKEGATINISLAEKKNLLDEVKVTSVRAKVESVKSLLVAQKNSIRVSDGISGETIKRTPDKNTAEVLKRVSGASIQDNKFVIIRGLNERYNASYLNGAPLPSSEPDRKAFSFDIFPANVIDNLVIYKTASPDLPGEFAGGVIEITTKAIPSKAFQTLSISGGYNTITTGKKQMYATGGSTDWLGIDNGTRAFPTGFPSTEEYKKLQTSSLEADKLKMIDLSKSTATDWNLYEKSFSPNTSFQFSMGDKITGKGDTNFGYTFSLSNSITNNFTNLVKKTYEQNPVKNIVIKDLSGESYSTQTLFGVMANFALKLDQFNTFSFKNLYSISSDKRIIQMEGPLAANESDPLAIINTGRIFRSNNIYTGQLNGDHFLSKPKIKINWTSSFSNVVRSTPNDRINTLSYIKYDDGTPNPPTAYYALTPSSINTDASGYMLSSKNTENTFSFKIDVNRKFSIGEKFTVDIKTGFFNQERDRVFDTRQMAYLPFKGRVGGFNYSSSTFQSSIATLPEGEMFSANNMGIIGNRVSGLVLNEGTKDNDSYKASSQLSAGYLMFDNSFGKFRLVLGARIENFLQYLNSRYDNGDIVNVIQQQNDFLPSANLIYAVTKTQNIRLSYSKTLNRPEFRELAPFIFYDFETRRTREGSPDLKIATINNYDFRYEIYPGKGQLFSISAFYKKFLDPIEIQSKADNVDKYRNGISGENKGIEIEYRTLLSSLVGTKENKLLDNITLYTNVSVIRSKADVSNFLTNTKNSIEIPLQGQSPYVFNAGLQYIDTDLGWASSINLNRIGNRIAVHANNTPGLEVGALWEKSRTFLDFQLAKTLFKSKFEIKVNVQNLLAQDQVFYYKNYTDTDESVSGFEGLVNNIFAGDKNNRNAYNEKTDDIDSIRNFGRTYSLTLTYNF